MGNSLKSALLSLIQTEISSGLRENTRWLSLSTWCQKPSCATPIPRFSLVPLESKMWMPGSRAFRMNGLRARLILLVNCSIRGG